MKLIVVCLINTLKQDIGVPTLQANGTVNGNDLKYDNRTQEGKQKRCINAIKILSRIPLGPIPGRMNDEILAALLRLDKLAISGSRDLSFVEDGNRIEFLHLVRSAAIRFLRSIGKLKIEVTFEKGTF